MKTILKNIKTSIAGSIAGLPMLLNGISAKDPVQIISGLGILITGLLAKDAHAQDGK